jgi:ParB-like nuclease domain
MTSVVAETNTSLSRYAAAVTALKVMGGWSLAPILEEPSHGCVEGYIKGPHQLKPRARNPRTHTAKQIKLIAASIKEFGFISPILIDGARRNYCGTWQG